ncbi:MAG TPA: hypothetical protein VJU61_08440 [Polyangiaceae bacterium]|nr:hypothetical protein [Polyangiaceae bacterium]
MDRHAGETTLVALQVVDGMVHGASVGDSRAWLVGPGKLVDLTGAQVRKPLLGTGAAAPVALGPHELSGRLLVGTDGLFNYASPEILTTAALHAPLDQAVSELVDRARLPTGGLQDDIAIVVGEWVGQLIR